ncbi:MAG: hypothetical protein V4535_08925 [Bacteroidota bacterium]
MKNSFKKALRLFKYLLILFSITYWIYIVIDDWNFIEEYWDTNWLEYIQIWIMYFIAYVLTFIFYYWLIATAIVLIYHKLIKRTG